MKYDVVVVGSGPAGTVTARFAAENGAKVIIIDRRQEIGVPVLCGEGISRKIDEWGMLEGKRWIASSMDGARIYSPDGTCVTLSAEMAGNETGYVVYRDIFDQELARQAVKAGAKIFNCISVEDVMIDNNGVCGAVINWSSVDIAGLHVDPLSVRSKYLVEATGHQLEVLKVLEKKVEGELFTKSGKIMGEKLMNAEVGEKTVVENTKEIYRNVFVVGMAANAAFGANRMGPIFGGMLVSGKKLAEILIDKLDKTMALCEMIKEAQENDAFYVGPEDWVCVGVEQMILGMKDPEPVLISGMLGGDEGLYKAANACRAMYQYLPRMPKGSVQYVAFAPVDKLSFDPDVIVITANINQAQTLVRSINYSTGEPFVSKATPVVACSWIFVYPVISGELNYYVTGLGLGMQAMNIFPPGLFLISVPWQKLPTMLENLQEMLTDYDPNVAPPPSPGGAVHRKRVNKLIEDLKKRIKE